VTLRLEGQFAWPSRRFSALRPLADFRMTATALPAEPVKSDSYGAPDAQSYPFGTEGRASPFEESLPGSGIAFLK
jgi:hypothetical protein